MTTTNHDNVTQPAAEVVQPDPVRYLQVKLPENLYQAIRRLAFERETTHQELAIQALKEKYLPEAA